MDYFSRANLLSLSLCCLRHVTRRRVSSCAPPRATGKAQGPPSQRWGRTQQLGVAGCCTRNRAARLGTPIALSPFLCSRRCCCCCCAPVRQHRRPRPEPTSQPPSQNPRGREVVVMVVVVGLRGPFWPCVGSATSAQLGLCCPGRGDSPSGRVKQQMTVSPCGRMQEGNHPGGKVGSTAYCNSCSGKAGGGGYVDGGGRT